MAGRIMIKSEQINEPNENSTAKKETSGGNR
jgi:hypothetical protein